MQYTAKMVTFALIALIGTSSASLGSGYSRGGCYSAGSGCWGWVCDPGGLCAFVEPGNPRLPEKGISVIVDPDIDWGTLQVDVTVQRAEDSRKSNVIEPAPAGVAVYVDDAGRTVRKADYGEGKTIRDGKNLDVYDCDELYPASIAELLPYSQYMIGRSRTYDSGRTIRCGAEGGRGNA